MTKINEKIMWAFSDQALNAIKTLEDKGLDTDLAIALLEALCASEELYDLPKEDLWTQISNG